jgi:glutamate 5-kinase
MTPLQERERLKHARRLVIKVGTRVLVQSSGRPDARRMAELVRQIAALHARGTEVVLVSSGAIGAGMAAMGMKRRPTSMPELQMAAAVGQLRLMAAYDRLFSKYGCRIGQILLTHDDLKHRVRHLNASTTMLAMLRRKVIPIVNENDVVSVDEIKFGDNDQLASLVTLLIEADGMILLSTVQGLLEPAPAGRSRRIPLVRGITRDILGLARGKGGALSTGGMLSKLQSAAVVVASGIPVAIANGRKGGELLRVCDGEDAGTLVVPAAAGAEALPSHRKRWIAFFHRTSGTLAVDDGAREAILARGRSLLPIGVRAVEGEFERSAMVDIRGLDGGVFARGLASYSSAELRKIQGRKTSEIAPILGSKDYDEVVHRDNLVVLGDGRK